MILGDAAPAAASDAASALTIDGIFAAMAQRRPDALALADAPNRSAFADGPPRRLTYAQADHAVTAIAARLRDMELPTDSVIGIQLPNTVENVLTILAVLRAGMIAAPLPLLWRRAEAVAALGRVGAKALITAGRVGGFDGAVLGLRIAAEVFSIRYVCGFGANRRDGVVAFDDLIDGLGKRAGCDPLPATSDRTHAARHLAAITFDVAEAGIVPVARSHAELLAGGLSILLESGLAADAALVSTLAPASFAGICLTLLPWLLRGGTLGLHHPLDLDVLASQWRSEPRCAAAIVPAAVAFRLAEAKVLDADAPETVLALWRAPERLAASPAWPVSTSTLLDVAALGETGLVAARRNGDGRPAPLPLGRVAAPRRGDGAVTVAEFAQSGRGTLMLRGPMVPHHCFPASAERGNLPYLAIAADSMVDSGYACQRGDGAGSVTVSGAPAGITTVGGCRLPLHDLQDAVRRIDPRAALATLPDPLLGRRLVGTAEDRTVMRAALAALGANPLVVAAFADHEDRGAAARHANAVR